MNKNQNILYSIELLVTWEVHALGSVCLRARVR